MKTIDIIAMLTQKWKSKSTGALFLLDANQKLVQIYFINGEMVSIKSRNISGKNAISELAKMKAIKFQFHDGAETRNNNDLPSTETIISALADLRQENSQKQLLPDHLEEKARELFMDFVGPIADVIFEEQVEKSLSADNLVRTLSSYIDNDRDRKEFIDTLRSMT